MSQSGLRRRGLRTIIDMEANLLCVGAQFNDAPGHTMDERSASMVEELDQIMTTATANMQSHFRKRSPRVSASHRYSQESSIQKASSQPSNQTHPFRNSSVVCWNDSTALAAVEPSFVHGYGGSNSTVQANESLGTWSFVGTLPDLDMPGSISTTGRAPISTWSTS